jgi:hypothetical protein
LHSLIKDDRDARRVSLNIEHRFMLQMEPDHQLLTWIQKVEVCEYALARTTGQDLAKVLWLNSQTSEMWLDRRTNYTRSLAVMCMAVTAAEVAQEKAVESGEAAAAVANPIISNPVRAAVLVRNLDPGRRRAASPNSKTMKSFKSRMHRASRVCESKHC